MVRVGQLRDFLTEAQAAIPEITRFELVASDDRYSRFAREVRHQDQEVFLIALLPSHKPSRSNEDNVMMMSTLNFMVIRKLSQSPGSSEYDETFEIAEEAIFKLFGFIVEKKQSDSECIFKDFDLDSMLMMPVENFHQTNGWDLSIRLKTNFTPSNV